MWILLFICFFLRYRSCLRDHPQCIRFASPLSSLFYSLPAKTKLLNFCLLSLSLVWMLGSCLNQLFWHINIFHVCRSCCHRITLHVHIIFFCVSSRNSIFFYFRVCAQLRQVRCSRQRPLVLAFMRCLCQQDGISSCSLYVAFVHLFCSLHPADSSLGLSFWSSGVFLLHGHAHASILFFPFCLWCTFSQRSNAPPVVVTSALCKCTSLSTFSLAVLRGFVP